MGRGIHPGEVELGVSDGAHGGDEHRHVLRDAAGHNGVHGDGVNGGFAAAGRQNAHNLKGVAGRTGEHGGDPLLRRGE